MLHPIARTLAFRLRRPWDCPLPTIGTATLPVHEYRIRIPCTRGQVSAACRLPPCRYAVTILPLAKTGPEVSDWDSAFRPSTPYVTQDNTLPPGSNFPIYTCFPTPSAGTHDENGGLQETYNLAYIHRRVVQRFEPSPSSRKSACKKKSTEETRHDSTIWLRVTVEVH